MSKTALQEDKSSALQQLLDCVVREIQLVISNARCMRQQYIDDIPWNIKSIFVPFIENSPKYLTDVQSFINTGNIVKDKILSFHLNDVTCITKNKPGKKYQFGRIFQLGRVKGNFLFAGRNETPIQPDKKSIGLMLDAHA